MLLTNTWVNAVSIGIVAASMWQVWRVTHARRTRAAARKPPVSHDTQPPCAHARGNQAEIALSQMCGCLHCGRIFHPAEIAGWVEQTALCPHCGRAAVASVGSGITPQPELLRRSHRASVEIDRADDRGDSSQASNG